MPTKSEDPIKDESKNESLESFTQMLSTNLKMLSPTFHLYERVSDSIDHVVGDAIFRGKRFPNNRFWRAKATGLCLVYRGNKNQCVFQFAHLLVQGKTVPLTLTSHPGGICKQRYHWMHKEQVARTGFWSDYVETCGGSTDDAVHCSYDHNNYLALHEMDASTGKLNRIPFLVDVEKWNVVPGQRVHFAKINVTEDKMESGT